MKKIIFALVMVLLLLAGYHYFYLTPPSVMQTAFNIKSNQPFIIKLPDSNFAVTLDKTIRAGGQNWIEGHYINGDERGTITFDFHKITPLLQHNVDRQFFVAPFIVSNQGSGMFYYLGLFQRKDNNILHLSSFFLGDRIDIKNIRTQHDDIAVLIHERAQTQPETIKIKVLPPHYRLVTRDNP